MKSKTKKQSKTIEISEATIYFKKKLSKKAKYKVMEEILDKYPIERIFFREVFKI